jgi:hypothetical protein
MSCISSSEQPLLVLLLLAKMIEALLLCRWGCCRWHGNLVTAAAVVVATAVAARPSAAARAGRRPRACASQTFVCTTDLFTSSIFICAQLPS